MHRKEGLEPAALQIVPFSPTSEYFEGALRVYTETWGWGWSDSWGFFGRYATYPEYAARAALYRGEVAGMGFGARSLPGQWWHDKVAERVGADNPARQDAWVLVELAVKQQHRGRGVGTALHDALLEAQPCPRALLSTEVENTGARRLYERLGWEYLHAGFVFSAGGPAYVIMHREVEG